MKDEIHVFRVVKEPGFWCKIGMWLKHKYSLRPGGVILSIIQMLSERFDKNPDAIHRALKEMKKC